jgi:hypothetical protein
MRVKDQTLSLTLSSLAPQVITTFRTAMIEKNMSEVNQYHLVLVEGEAKKSTTEHPTLTGRSDGNKRCVFDANDAFLLNSQDTSIPLRDQFQALLNMTPSDNAATLSPASTFQKRLPVSGDYVVFKTEESKGQTLYGKAIAITSLMDYYSSLR